MRKLISAVLILFTAAGSAFANGAGDTAAAGDDNNLTVWEGLWANTAVSVSTLADTPLYKKAMEATGINVTWIHPPRGQESENFNLMVAANDLPDIVYTTWSDYPGGPEKAIGDGVIIGLNDPIKAYAPNYWSYLQSNSQAFKEVKTDEGVLYGFNFFRGDDLLKVYFGPQLRKDWLEELGLEPPETIAEWETVLKAFKESGKAEYPLGFTKIKQGRSMAEVNGVFIQAFETSWDFYLDDQGRVQYGPLDDQFKDFLTLFNRWYKMGLIDPEFMSCERKTFEAKVLNNELGAWCAPTGSGIGAFLDAKKDSGDGFDIVAAKYPVLKKGDTPFFGQMDYTGLPIASAITTQCDNVALACRWLDYGYSEEGSVLFNFGIEGESFQWVKDYPGFERTPFPRFTDLMTNNPEGKTLSQMGGLFTRSFYNGSLVQRKEYILQYAARPAQREAMAIWSQTDAKKHLMPQISSTPEESEDLASILSEINTYREEMAIKYIIGIEPLSSFDTFQSQLKKMGIERAIEIKQAGVSRFANR